MTPLSDAEVREIAARAEDATPGPWMYGPLEYYGKPRWLRNAKGDSVITSDGSISITTSEDADFIVAARSDVPRLCDALLAAREVIDFCGDIASEELPFAKVGTGAEVALRHIVRKVNEARAALGM